MRSPSKTLEDFVNRRASNMSNFKEMKTPRSQVSLACGIISMCGVVRPNIFATSYSKHEVYPCPVDVVSFGHTPKGKFTKFVFPHDLKNHMYIEISQAKWGNINHMNKALEGIMSHATVIRDGIKSNYFHYIITIKGNREEILHKMAKMYEQFI